MKPSEFIKKELKEKHSLHYEEGKEPAKFTIWTEGIFNEDEYDEKEFVFIDEINQALSLADKKFVEKEQHEKEIKELIDFKHAYNILNREHTQMEKQLSKRIEIEEVEKMIDEFYEAHAGDSKWHIPLRELKQKLTKKRK